VAHRLNDLEMETKLILEKLNLLEQKLDVSEVKICLFVNLKFGFLDHQAKNQRNFK